MKSYFAVIGLICLVLAAWLAARRLRAQFFGAIAIGHVAGHEAREFDDSISYLPVVTYLDAAGKQHRFTSVAGGVTKLPPGTRVTIRYLPSAPDIAYVSGFLPMWSAPVALFVLGVAGMGAAAFQHQTPGNTVRQQPRNAATRAPDTFRPQGRIPDLMSAGKLTADLGSPQFNPLADCATLCGITQALAPGRAGVQKLDLQEGSAARPRDFVVQRAVLDQLARKR